MADKTAGVQPLRTRDAVIAAVAIGTGALNLALWFLAPGLLKSMIGDTAIPVSILLILFCIFLPVVLAWLIVRGDDGERDESFETSGH
jgi:hypothetical protein